MSERKRQQRAEFKAGPTASQAVSNADAAKMESSQRWWPKPPWEAGGGLGVKNVGTAAAAAPCGWKNGGLGVALGNPGPGMTTPGIPRGASPPGLQAVTQSSRFELCAHQSTQSRIGSAQNQASLQPS